MNVFWFPTYDNKFVEQKGSDKIFCRFNVIYTVFVSSTISLFLILTKEEKYRKTFLLVSKVIRKSQKKNIFKKSNQF